MKTSNGTMSLKAALATMLAAAVAVGLLLPAPHHASASAKAQSQFSELDLAKH